MLQIEKLLIDQKKNTSVPILIFSTTSPEGSVTFSIVHFLKVTFSIVHFV